ncbi:myb-like protein X [Vespula maculifrons]|uniref:Myb-like protein X n=1 Tax=Vespula maculifrons TaxID=7453 RepID=A0ABD2CLU6_VESMC
MRLTFRSIHSITDRSEKLYYLKFSTSSKIFLVLLGNTINDRAGINSKTFPFETSFLSLTYSKTTFLKIIAKNLLDPDVVLFYKARTKRRLHFKRRFPDSSLIPSCSTLRNIQRSREGKVRISNNVDSAFEYRTNVNLDSNWLENYMYRNNVYFNAIRVIRNDKENLRAIHKDTKKEVLRINFEENGEQNGDTGDEEGEGEDKDESHFDIGRISWKIMMLQNLFLRIIQLDEQLNGFRKDILNQPKTKTVPIALDLIQRSRIDLYLNCNSKKDKKSSTTFPQIKLQCTSKVKHIYIDTICSSVHTTILPTWIRYTKPTEDESSSKSLDVLRRSRIHLYLNFKFKTRYKKFNNVPPDNITLHIQNYMQSKKVLLFISEFISNILNEHFILDVKCLMIILSLVEIHISFLDVDSRYRSILILCNTSELLELLLSSFSLTFNCSFNYAAIKGNTINDRAEINSKTFPFETSFFSLTYSYASSLRGYNRLRSEGSSKRRTTVHTDRGSKWNVFSNGEIFLRREEYFIPESSLIPSSSTLSRLQLSREGKIRIYNNVDSVFEYRANVNLDSNWLENYIYGNNVYFNAIREIRNDKENLRAIHKDSKKEVLLINVEEKGKKMI